jgi:hypothetical protein
LSKKRKFFREEGKKIPKIKWNTKDPSNQWYLSFFFPF